MRPFENEKFSIQNLLGNPVFCSLFHQSFQVTFLFAELDSWMDYKTAFWFTLFLWLFSMLTLLTAWLTKSKCKESQGGDGRGSQRRPNINEEEPAEEKDEALPALLSVRKLNF